LESGRIADEKRLDMSIHDTDRSLYRQATVAAILVIVFILTCTAHEVVGHGGMCKIVGGHINLVSSVYFRSTGGGVLTDAAGPVMNLIVGAICWFILRRWMAPPILWRLFLVLAMAFNLFWGAGCFILSAVTNTGDWAFVLRQLQLEPVWVWRVVIGVIGVFIYRWSIRFLASQLPSGTPLFVPYLATGIFSCFAALFFFGPVAPAVREAALRFRSWSRPAPARDEPSRTKNKPTASSRGNSGICVAICCGRSGGNLYRDSRSWLWKRGRGVTVGSSRAYPPTA
jgi:hypothetical protein